MTLNTLPSWQDFASKTISLIKFESEMENIVGMVEKLPDIQDEMTLDPDNPMILRKDVAVQDKFTRQELMQNAPQVKAGCLVVPKTVE